MSQQTVNEATLFERTNNDHSDSFVVCESQKTVSADITVHVDNHVVTALVNTGADYSIMSRALAFKRKKVTTPWQEPSLRTAGGHLMMPTGMCIVLNRVRSSWFTGFFLVITVCSHPLTLAMDIHREYGAIIHLKGLFVSLEDLFHTEPEKKTLYVYPLNL